MAEPTDHRALPDERLERILAGIGEHLVVSDSEDAGEEQPGRPREHRSAPRRRVNGRQPAPTLPAADVPRVDRRLERILASVGEQLVAPEADVDWAVEHASCGEAVDARPTGADGQASGETVVGSRHQLRPSARRLRSGPRLGVAAAVVAAALLVAGVVTPVREAVAGWLGVGATRIETGGLVDTAELPGLLAGLRELGPGEAASLLGRPLPEVGHPSLGPPRLLAAPDDDGVILAWQRGATSLWLRYRPTSSASERVKLGAGSVEPIAGLGEQALYVASGHALALPGRLVAATSVLLWVEDGVEYRLESDLDRSEMLAIARSVVS